MTPTPYHVIRKALHEHFSAAVERQRKQMDQSGPLSVLDKAAFDTSVMVALGAVQGRNSLDIIDGDDDTLSRFIEKYGLSIEPGSEEYELLRKELPKAYRDYVQKVIDLNQSLDSYDYSERRESAQMPTETAPTSLRDAIEKYTDEEVRIGKWVARTEAQAKQHLALLQEFIAPDTAIGRVTGEQARSVRDALLKLPRNMKKNPATAKMTLSEVLSVEHKDRLSVRTVNDYLQTYNSLFSWAGKLHMTGSNPFAGMALAENRKNTQQGLAFSTEQLRGIEAALIADSLDIRPKTSHKWASLIALYTGARLNEVCQLTVQDIRQIDGAWFFDINANGDGKHLKNEASVRLIPVHSRLIEFGLLEYVNAVQRRSTRLFPDYSYFKNYGWGKSLSVWFNDSLLVRLGIKAKGLRFHSLRTTMSTRLLQADVLLPTVQAILGHAKKTVTEQFYFTDGYKPEQLKAAIEKFGFHPETDRNGP